MTAPTTPRRPGWLVRTRTFMEHGRLVTVTLPDDHEDEPCDVCEQDWCHCDAARDNAMVTVPSLAACRAGRSL